jgi:Na+/H+ antiporter NhaD/arsenite permease-like protein
VGILLAVFYLWDRRAWSRESAADRALDRERIVPLGLRGGPNLVLLAGVLASVVFCRRYQMAGGAVWDVSWMQQPVMLVLALLSLALDRAATMRRKASGQAAVGARELNGFTFGPIIEVAVVFIGIFVTMIPAVCLLAAYGSKAGISTPAQFYWVSGGFSSFVDNAPAYATGFALGQSVTGGLLNSGQSLAVVLAHGGPIASRLLMAISLGSVFMGANTYIGNAPNLMVKSICDEAGVKMPGFLGYMLYAAAVLVPTYVLITILYLR